MSIGLSVGRRFHWYVKFDNQPPLQVSAYSWTEFQVQMAELVHRHGWFQWVIEDGSTCS